MITFSSIIHTGSTQNTSIAFPRYIEFQFDSNLGAASFPTVSGQGHRIGVKPANWINPTTLPESAASLPSQAYWDILTTGKVVGVDYPMNWVAGSNANNQRNGNLFIRFTIVAAKVRITLKWYWQNLEDMQNYITSPIPNKDKLLKDALSNTIILDNAQIDVYSNPREYRLGLWWVEPVSNSKSFLRLGFEEQIKFFGPYPGQWTLPEFTSNSCAGSFVVNNQSNVEFTFQITKITGAAVTRASWLLVRVDSSDNTIFYQDNAEILNTGYLKAGGGATPFAAWNLDNTDLRIVSSTAFAVFSGAVWESKVVIDPTKLTASGKYRLFFIIESAADTWTFLCDEISVSICNCFTPPDVVENSLTDFLTVFGDNAIMSPQERAKSCVELDTTVFDLALGIVFTDALQFVTVSFYEDDPINPNIRHIFEEYQLNRNALNVFQIPASPANGQPKQWSFICSGNQFRVCQDFRLRYESDVKNLRTINRITNANLGQLSNMDWVLRTIIIEYKLHLETAFYKIDLFVKQQIFVHDYATIDPTLTIPDSMNWNVTDAITGDPITTYCVSDVPRIVKVCSGAQNSTSVSGNNRFLSGVDLKPYSINNFIEDDGTFCPAGLLPYLLNANVSLQDCEYNQSAPQVACFNFELPNLPGKDIRFVAIKKALDTTSDCPCGDIDAQAVIDAMIALGFPPSDNRAGLICATVIALKACGVWLKLDRIWFSASHNEMVARINWKDPFNLANRLIPFNGVDTGFIIDGGYIGDGVSWYLDTQFNPLIDGFNYAISGSGFGQWRDGGGGIEPFAYDTTPTTKGITGFILDFLYLHDEELRLYQPIPPFAGAINLRSGYRDGSTIGSFCYSYGDGAFNASINLVTAAKRPQFNWLMLVGTDGATGANTPFFDSAAFKTKISYFSGYLDAVEHNCLYLALKNYIDNLPLTLI